jgi:hypothetical protein
LSHFDGWQLRNRLGLDPAWYKRTSRTSPEIARFLCGQDLSLRCLRPPPPWRIMQAETTETESTLPDLGKRTVTVLVFV